MKFLDWQLACPEQLGNLPSQTDEEAAAKLSRKPAPPIHFDPQTLRDKLTTPGTTLLAKVFSLKKEHERYKKMAGAWHAHFARQREAQSRERLKRMQYDIGSMCRAVKQTSSAAISRLNCSTEPGKQSISTDPAKIDATLQSIWGAIHGGNLGPHSANQCGELFLQRYGEFFSFNEEFQVKTIDVDDLRHAIAASPDNTPGLDGVRLDDFKILSTAALEWLARMFAAIEAGANWPSQLLAGRTAWLDKTEGPSPSLNPLDYRALAILSKVYRLYGAIRLRHLSTWVKQWEKRELFAGTTAPTGAEDAWYLMGLDLEMARLTGMDFTGGSSDIWKCFDQFQRAMLYYVLEASGFPKPILRAYAAFHEQVQYHNTISGGLGAPHRKPCSIPQGCPFSMMLTGFTFHPWAAKIRAMQAILRGLADDLTIIAIGPGHERRFKLAYGETINFLHTIGAKPAPTKCFTFSSSADTRFRLRNHYWQEFRAKVTVVCEFRDLGGHVSTGPALGGPP